jgi:tRNA nucleotidyltransferase (CCA-adding enzyme)
MRLKFLSEQMGNKKKALDKLVDPNLLRLSQLYSSNGYDLRIVGGAVRDILQNKEPKDIDLASDATPQESMELLKSNDIKVIETGLQHGTIVAHMGGEDYEITTLRIDTETDGRHATVEYTRDWKQDAERRDLTFNAMSMDFDGNLYDYHGGHDDLKSGQAKFVGDSGKRIQEDYLRILRYFRFQGRMDNPSFDPDTIAQIKENADGLQKISGERIWSEVAKILTGSHVGEIMNVMRDTGVTDNIGLPTVNVDELARVKQNTNDPDLLLSALLPENAFDKLRDRWKFSNPEAAVMKFVLKNRGTKLSFQDAKRMHIMGRVDKQLIEKLLEYQGETELSTKLSKWSAPSFPVNGDDLKAAGISPGPEMGKILNDLKSKWVDSGYTIDRNALLNQI